MTKIQMQAQGTRASVAKIYHGDGQSLTSRCQGIPSRPLVRGKENGTDKVNLAFKWLVMYESISFEYAVVFRVHMSVGCRFELARTSAAHMD